MPQRLNNLPVFDTPPPPIAQEPPVKGPSFQDFMTNVEILSAPARLLTGGMPVLSPEAHRVWDAAFSLENDVVNAVQLLTKPAYQADPTFNPEQRLKDDGMWDMWRDNFIGVQSEAEYNDVAAQILKEQKAKETLAAHGPVGMVAAMTAGLASPTMFLPFVGPGAKGAKMVGQALFWGGVGGLAQEIPLQLNQETRSLEESAFSVGMSTVVAGVLGGAVAYLGRNVDDVADDMARQLNGQAIPVYGKTGVPESVGAAAAERVDAGGLKSALWQEDEFAGQIGPVTQNLQQSLSPQGRWMTAQLADAGLTLERNIEGLPTSPGGVAENRIKTWWGKVADSFVSVDDMYARYMYGTEGKTSWLAQQKAKGLGILPGRAKLSRQEFKYEIAKAMNNGDQHEIKEVAEAANYFRTRIYDPLFKLAQEVGIYAERIAEEGEEAAPPTYLNRDYNLQAIRGREPEFVDLLTAHFEKKLEAQFKPELEWILGASEKAAQREADFSLPPDRVKEIREQVQEALTKLEESMTPEEADLEEFIGAARQLARDKTQPQSIRDDAKEQLKILEGMAATPEKAARAAQKRKLKQRLHSLNRARFVLEERRLKKLLKIDRAEELALASLNRAVRASQKFLAKIDSLSDEKLAGELSKLRNQFAKLADQYDAGEERIAALRADETDAKMGHLLFGAEFKQADRADKLTTLANAIEDAENIDPATARLVVLDALDEILLKTQRLNNRRALRTQRLEDAAQDLSPERVATEIANVRKKVDDRKAAFFSEWGERGAVGIKLETGFTPSFRNYAHKIARSVTDKIKGTNARLAGHDLLMEPKGAELARVLDVPYSDIAPFLENDVEHLVNQYVRTLAPDIEITRKLGEFAPDKGRNLEFQKLREEEETRKRQVTEEMTAAGKTPEQIEKEMRKIDAAYRKIDRNLEAIIGRMRHTWGIPADPMGFAYRAGRVAMNLNVLRYMNMVMFSSIPDLGMPIMKYGLMRTFKDGWGSFIGGLAKGQFNQRELQLAGAALDMVTHSRAHAMTDINDIMVRGTRFEKGLEYATSNIGLVAAFDIWTTAMKQVAGAAGNAELVDDIRRLIENKTSNKVESKADKKSIERLAANGIGADEATIIWKELSKPGGGDVVNGVLWPNTEAWDNSAGAVDIYRQAIVRQVESTIVTPGVERPKWTDSNLVAKMLWQFHSFAASSTTKVFLAGLQKRDFAVLYGAMISLALGGLSYYVSAKLAGGKAEETMEAAIRDGNWGHFADEAIGRSGLTVIFGDILNILDTIPGAAPYVRFGGQKTSRTGGNDLIDQLGGVSMDLAQRTAAVIAKGSQGDFDRSFAHNLRLMLPLQNHWLLRRALNRIEEAFPE